ncbi:MAG: hypothetical protein DRH04_00345 [Deltaproteobacteria bacterium]|nr:MAG: hypothetical protein DRH04_00345 [Deltaproteobacteria bacterium]
MNHDHVFPAACMKTMTQHSSLRTKQIIILFLISCGVLLGGYSSAAAEKMLESIKIGSFKEKSRVVLQLSSAGFYEIDNQADQAVLQVRLFDFKLGSVPPRQLVKERLLKEIQVHQEEQFLLVRLSLVTSHYHYRAHLFKSPPMLVIDFTGCPPPVSKGTAEPGRSEEPEPSAADLKLKPQSPEMAGEKSPPVVEAEPEPAVAKAASEKKRHVDVAPLPETSAPNAEKPALPVESSSSPRPGSMVEDTLPDKRESTSQESTSQESGSPEKPLAASGEAGENTASENDLYEQGLSYYLAGELEKAMESFTRLVTLFPHSALVPKALFRYNDALAQQAAGDDKQNLHHLIDNYLKVVRTYPQDSDAPWALLQVGGAYERMGFHYEAEGVYQALAHQYPRSRFAAAAWYEIARINYALKRYRKALHAYRQLTEKYSRRGFSAEAAFYQAHCLYHLGDFAAAMPQYQAALKKFPEYLHTDPQSIYLLGSCYLSLKKYQQARDYLLMMRNLFPDNKFTNLALAKVGDSLLAQGKLVEGIAFLATVVKEYPESDGEILARLAMARLGKENPRLHRRPELKAYVEYLDPQHAYRFIVDNYAKNPLSDVARLRLGRLLYQQHDYAGARHFFDQLLPARVHHEIRSVAFNEMRQVIFDELKADYQQKKYAAMVALQERYGNTFLPRPTGMYPFLWLAEAMRHQGLYAGALKLYASLQGFNPSKEEFLTITWGMASCHLALGEVKDADGLLNPLSMHDLENSWWIKMMLLKADIMIRTGKNREAVKLLGDVGRRLPVGSIPERISLLTMLAEASSNGGKLEAAVTHYREAITLANDHPQLVDMVQRVALVSAMARILFVKGDYQAALAAFRQAALLVEHHDSLAELLYWQSLCYSRLGQKKELDDVIKLLRSRYRNSDWTSLAISNLKDYQWKTGSPNLQ